MADAPFLSPLPRVTLVNAFTAPLDNAVATARTCYSSKLVTAAEVHADEAGRDRIAESVYRAGHHTIFQHAHFQFTIQNVSRQLLWSFLHAHPFYNSEQVSQRYVAVRPEHVLVPALPEPALRRYRETVAAEMAGYEDLVGLLLPAVTEAYLGIFPARRKSADSYRGACRKKTQEVARYVLPIATFAHLYHTVSGLTLHRYHRLANSFDVPTETAYVIEAMIAAVNAHDPAFFRDIEDPLPLEQTHEYRALAALERLTPGRGAREFCAEYDRGLDGHVSRLVDYKVHAEVQLAAAVREVLGLGAASLTDDAAISLLLSPRENPLLSETLTLTSLGKLGRALCHPHYTFAKKLSHSADSQDQRHRLTPGTRPVLATHYSGGEPDVILPALIADLPQARELFGGLMRRVWHAVDELLDAGVEAEQALYLLPNAFPIRFTESGDLAALHHKWTTRLCYNAQAEIWRATLDEVRQVRALHPRLGAHLLPPCGLRAEAAARPVCPEGPRFCGVSVWKLELDEYARLI